MMELWLLPLLCTYNVHDTYFLRITSAHCSHEAINLAGSLTICEETADEIWLCSKYFYST